MPEDLELFQNLEENTEETNSERIDFETLSKKEIHLKMIPLEIAGRRPTVTRMGRIKDVIELEDERLLIITFNDIDVFMFSDEMPDKMKKKSKKKLIGERITFRPIAIKDDKILVSYKEINSYYKEMLSRNKILPGKICEIKELKTGKKYVVIRSRGDYIYIPAKELVDPISEYEKKIGEITEFIITDVRKDIKFGSLKIVHEFHLAQVNYILENGGTVIGIVHDVQDFGANLKYKHDVDLILRNKDFATDYTSCKDVLKPGDKIKVRLVEISKYRKNIFVQPDTKFEADAEISLEDINVGEEYDAEIVGVSAFGCFARITLGRDVLCPIAFNQREPKIGDKVRVLIKVCNPAEHKLRGRILSYKDELLDLDGYDLI